MAADKLMLGTMKYIIIIIIIVYSYSYYKANDCRLGCAEECVYLNSVYRRIEVSILKLWYPQITGAPPRRLVRIHYLYEL